MGNTYAGGVHVVLAFHDDKIEYWVAATPRADAAWTVQQLLPSGWTATLTDKRLEPEAVAVLNLKAGGARKLPSSPS
jgi:hypothetical protein